MKRAFTLIEVLIVIAILGLLAVAILVALDPIEQINRARDVQAVTAQGEIRGAIQRFYASKLRFPWCATTDIDDTCLTWITAGATNCAAGDGMVFGGTAPDDCAAEVLDELVDAGELKTTLPDPITSRLMLTLPAAGGGASYFVLFDPVSKGESAFEDNGTYFTVDDCQAANAGTAATCTGTDPGGVTDHCFICID